MPPGFLKGRTVGLSHLPQGYAGRIFTPFQRLHNWSIYEGSGMGLAICRKIVEYHGGEIKAKSIEGEGSTFTVILPARQPRR